MIRPQFTIDLHDEMIVDNFAGGGGASTGIELGLGRCVDLAVNHDPEAVAMHQANHPQTLHLCESVFDVDPVAVTKSRRVGLAWFSPDCTHFSKARGTKPRKKSIRGLAWVIIRWAVLVRPRVIMWENVEEFLGWGPLGPDGQPCPDNRGRTFQTFRDCLGGGISPDNPDIPEIIETLGADFPIERLYASNGGLGYDVETFEERACNHGAPTIRKRLFGIARCDGRPIVRPAHTHADPKRKDFKQSGLKPWRTAAECIDWRIPCPSIFERARPLAEATCRRIAKGIMRYVVNCADPFIVPLTHHDKSDRVTTMGDQMPTVTAAHRGELAVVAPVLTEHANASRQSVNSADEPLRTQCAGVKGGHFALIAPVIAGLAHGDHSKGAGRRVKHCEEPVGTIHAQGGNHAVVSAFLAKHFGTSVGSEISEPARTVVGRNKDSLVTAHVTKFRTGSVGTELSDPLATVTAGGKQERPGTGNAMGLVTGCLVPRYGEREGQEPRARDVKEPMPTIVPTGNEGSLVAAHIEKMHGTSTGRPADVPVDTIGAQGQHFAEVRAFLVKYYGNEQEGHGLRDPAGTVTTRDRFGLVTIHCEEYAITDIGLRMLAPRELFRAQGFPDDYIIGGDGRAGLTLTKSAQVRMCGNSVCPPLAAALVRANCPELSAWTKDDKRRRTA
jgi:DNA (cytosine-5)-methyltransferase 1